MPLTERMPVSRSVSVWNWLIKGLVIRGYPRASNHLQQVSLPSLSLLSIIVMPEALFVNVASVNLKGL